MSDLKVYQKHIFKENKISKKEEKKKIGWLYSAGSWDYAANGKWHAVYLSHPFA